MNPTSSIVLTGAIVGLNRWSTNQPFTMRIVIGLTGAAIGLAVVNEANSGLAAKIGELIVLSAALLYVPGIWNALGPGLSNKPRGASGNGVAGNHANRSAS